MTRHGHRGIDHDHGPNFLKPQWEPWGGEGVVFASSTTAGLMARTPRSRAKEAKENVYNATFGQPIKW